MTTQKKEKKRVPELRFPGFEGEWEKKRLESKIELLSGYAFKGDEITENSSGTPIMRGINITEGRIRHSETIDRYYLGDISKFERFKLKEGDIVLGMDGSKVGKNVAIISEEDTGSLLIQRVARIRAKKDTDTSFIYFNIFNPTFHRYVDVVNTSSGIPHISAKQIKEYKIGFPSFKEQQKIATFLTSIDTRLQQLEKKKTLLEQYKKGVMQKIFSQEIRFRRDDGEEFGKWEEKTIKEIFKSLKGKGIPKRDVDENGEDKCILYGELYTQYSEVVFDVKSKTNSTEGLLSKKGDLLMPSSTTTTGIDLANITALNIDNVRLGGDIIILRSKIKISNIFYAYYLSNYKKHEIASRAQGITIVHIYYNSIKDLIIDVPKLEEQTKIAQFLSALDRKIAVMDGQIEKTKEWKKGLLQRMFV